MKIATIYNDADDIRMSIYWNETTGLITYKNVETGEEWDADETSETLQEAIEDTYARYCTGWDLEIEEKTIENS